MFMQKCHHPSGGGIFKLFFIKKGVLDMMAKRAEYPHGLCVFTSGADCEVYLDTAILSKVIGETREVHVIRAQSSAEVFERVSTRADAIGVVPMYVTNAYGGDCNNLEMYINAYRLRVGKIPFKILCAVYTSRKPKRGFHVLCHASNDIAGVETMLGKNQCCIFRVKDAINGSVFEACRMHDHYPFRERFALAMPHMVSHEEIYFGAEYMMCESHHSTNGIHGEYVNILFSFDAYPVYYMDV